MALLYDVKKKQTATAAATLLERLAGTELPLWKAFKLDQGPRGSGPPLWATELKGPSLSSYVSAPATFVRSSRRTGCRPDVFLKRSWWRQRSLRKTFCRGGVNRDTGIFSVFYH
ncbi:nonstructural protein [Trichinella pseudospiralis]